MAVKSFTELICFIDMHWPAKVVDSLSLSICWPRSLKKLFAAAITVYDYDRQSETFHVVVVGGHHAQFILQRSRDNIKEQDRLLCGDAVVTVTIALLLHHSHLLI